jgi:lipopolysaccharide/colanic/teichoic acid biosynthesis glycosyltransferase
LFIALTAAFSGAFTGSLIATRQETGLWEDNAPPPPAVTSEVERIHQSITGQPDRTPPSKRIFDLLLSIVGLVLSAPIWIASAFLVWFEDPGPILFVKNSVGKGGGNFRQYKFRSMVHQAEQSTGPVLATQDDERVLWIGRLLRKTALDELPQLLNILNGQMSFVGPRPQRTVLVQGYLQDLPVYAERHRVQPGLAGLAQVAGDYYLTPLQKLRFDRLYIQHLSLGYDLKLLTLAFLITFWYRWQKDWDGRLPRRLLHPS